MVPTATMSGRPSRPRSRDCGMRVQRARRLGHRAGDGMGVKGHGVIIAATLCRSPQGTTLFRDRWDPSSPGGSPDDHRPAARRTYPVIVFGVPVVVLLPLHATPGDQPPPLTAVRLLTEWSLDWWVARGHRGAGRALRGRAGRRCGGAGTAGRLGRSRGVPGRRAGHGGGGHAVRRSARTTRCCSACTSSQHMILTMVTPLFLALGAPVTLALRTLPRPAAPAAAGVLHSRLATGADLPAAGPGPVHRHPVRPLLLLALRAHPALGVLARVSCTCTS